MSHHGGESMKKIYANLLGNWTDITTSGKIDRHDPITYYNERWDELFKYDYTNIEYDGHNYRIHPTLIQVVN
jgi:hypothetical protein